MMLCGQSQVSTAFRMWVFRVRKRSDGTKDIKRLINVMKQGLRRRYFIHWFTVVNHIVYVEKSKQRSSQYMIQILKRIAKLELGRAVYKWKDWLQCLKDKKSGAYYVRRILSSGCCRQYLMKWKDVVNAIRRIEYANYVATATLKLKSSAVSILKRLLWTHPAVFFIEWKEYLKSLKLCRQALRRICMTMESKDKHSAFMTWRAKILAMRTFYRSTELLTRGFSRYSFNVTESAFLIWKSFAKRKSEYDTFSDRMFNLKAILEARGHEQARLYIDGKEKQLLSTIFQVINENDFF